MHLIDFLVVLAAAGISLVTAEIPQFNLNPQAVITRFESTLIAPNLTASPDLTIVFPGILGDAQPAGLIINPLANQPSKSVWTRYFEYIPAQSVLSKSVDPVAPGQEVTTIFALDTVRDIYLLTSITESGSVSAEQAIVESLTWTPSQENPKPALFELAVLAMDINGSGTFDFGPVQWNNIIVEAETEETAWCSSPTLTGATINWSHTTPVVTQYAGHTVCYIGQVVFIGA